MPIRCFVSVERQSVASVCACTCSSKCSRSYISLLGIKFLTALMHVTPVHPSSTFASLYQQQSQQVVKLKAGRPDFTSEVANIINTQQHISSITQVDRQATLANSTAETTVLGVKDDVDRRHCYLQQQQHTTVAQPCAQSDAHHCTALTSDKDIDISSDADHTALG
jgi:hypothetical protein